MYTIIYVDFYYIVLDLIHQNMRIGYILFWLTAISTVSAFLAKETGPFAEYISTIKSSLSNAGIPMPDFKSINASIQDFISSVKGTDSK